MHPGVGYDRGMPDTSPGRPSTTSRLGSVARAAIYLLTPLVAGGLGGIVTAGNIATWYRTLDRPSWTPPDWAFGPVWTTLYICIGIAGWLVARRGESGLARLWWMQLALNAAWSPVFFGLHQVGAAAAIIVAMWGAIAAFILGARRRAAVAALLFLPYLFWVSYATALTLEILRRNGASPE